MKKIKKEVKYKNSLYGLFYLLIVILLTACKANKITIHKNETGILVSNSGKVKKTLNEGKYRLSNSDTLFLFNTETNIDSLKNIGVLDKNDEFRTVNIIYRYKPVKDSIKYLYLNYGSDYKKYIVEPRVRKSVIETFKTVEYNNLNQEKVSNIIFSSARDSLRSCFVNLEQLKIILVN